MDRRSFLKTLGLGGAAAGAVTVGAFDPEFLSWVPGKKAFFDLWMPKKQVIALTAAQLAAITKANVDLFRVTPQMLRDLAESQQIQWTRLALTAQIAAMDEFAKADLILERDDKAPLGVILKSVGLVRFDV